MLLYLASLALSPAQGAEAQASHLLPRDHPYQRALRSFLGELQENDFDHAVTAPFTSVWPDAPEARYRLWLLSQSVQPVIGSKRGYPSVTAPPRLFLLSAIESDDAIMVPPVWPQPLAWLATWDYAGNPYFGSRALKLRAFAHCAVNLVMLDRQLETAPEKGGNRPDWFAPQLIRFAYPYIRIEDALPEEVRRAYETGLRKMATRLLSWGLKGEEPNMDAAAAIGLLLTARALGDPEFTQQARGFVERMLADPAFFHPAGYFVDRGGPDLSFGGMAAFLVNWTALAGDWNAPRDAAERWYRLMSHLALPEPDACMLSPTHFNSRTGGDAFPGQWEWGFRDLGGAMLTDEAAHLVELPSEEEMRQGLDKVIARLNHQVGENPRTRDENGKLRFLENDELASDPWQFRMWPSWNYPVTVNCVHDHCPADAHARRTELEQSASPFLESPFLRGETFVREFSGAFSVARMDGYAAIVHTGPVGRDALDNGLFHFAGPLGFGGGQLSAFWTPETGSVILGRRAGMSWDKSFDEIEGWRAWPIHAVSGAKADGKIFTSGRIADPRIESSLTAAGGEVRASGIIPRESLGQGKVLEGRIAFERTFCLEPHRVRIETRVSGTGQDTLTELYETIPVFLRESKKQSAVAPTAIEFVVDGVAAPATTNWHERVSAVRLSRFSGAVRLTFARPRRVALSASDWTDSYMTRACCRNVLIDMLDGQGPAVFREAAVSCTAAPEAAGGRPEGNGQ